MAINAKTLSFYNKSYLERLVTLAWDLARKELLRAALLLACSLLVIVSFVPRTGMDPLRQF